MRKPAFVLVFLMVQVMCLAAQTNEGSLDVTSPASNIHWSIHAKNLAQVLFWIAVGTIAILTYLGAKKTILQPIRTEIFKVQLEEMRNILAMFVGKAEFELREMHSFEKLLMANSTMMFDEYASTFFDFQVDLDTRPYCVRECPSSLITKEGAEKYLQLMDGHMRVEPEAVASKTDPRVRAALWVDYKHYHPRIPREFSEQQRRIQDLLENPLLPKKCLELLTEYIQTVDQNLESIRDLLTESASQMPEKYPSMDALKNSSLDWINHAFAERFVNLKPKADAVISFVRSSYDVDNLLKV